MNLITGIKDGRNLFFSSCHIRREEKMSITCSSSSQEIYVFLFIPFSHFTHYLPQKEHVNKTNLAYKLSSREREIERERERERIFSLSWVVTT